MFAILDNIGTTEMLIVAIAALLVFGKRLPEVASQAGTALARFKRDLSKTWDDTGMEREMRKLKDVLPKDMSMTDVARIAAQKMEQRLRDNVEETVNPKAAETPTAEVPPVPWPPVNASFEAAPPAATVEPPSSDAPASPSSPPSNPSGASGASGVDPAKHFGPPNSVPRDG